jgi:hypothetical protein
MVVNESVVSTQSTKRPWGKYLKRMAIGVLILAVLLRMAVPLALPSILNRIAAGQGLQIDYSKLDLSLFGGSMELWDVSICPVEQSPQSEIEPAAELSRLGQMEFLTVDVDLSALLGGTLRAHRVEIDGLDVFAKRESLEAGWTWATLLPGETSDTSEDAYVAKAEPSDDSQEEDAATAPFDWTLGFEVSAIRLQHLQLHVQDRGGTRVLRRPGAQRAPEPLGFGRDPCTLGSLRALPGILGWFLRGRKPACKRRKFAGRRPGRHARAAAFGS